jgi:hypothetical protein
MPRAMKGDGVAASYSTSRTDRNDPAIEPAPRGSGPSPMKPKCHGSHAYGLFLGRLSSASEPSSKHQKTRREPGLLKAHDE